MSIWRSIEYLELGCRYMNRIVPEKMVTTIRWDAQVEKVCASISRVDPHDSSEDAEIGSENGQEAAQLIKTGKSKNDSFIDTSV